MKVYIDGGVKKKNVEDSRGDGRYGFVIKRDDGSLVERAFYHQEDMTVPETEMLALVRAMGCLFRVTNAEPETISILSDSELVVKWNSGEYQCKADNIKPLLVNVKNFTTMLSAKRKKVEIKWIPREQNEAHVDG